MSLKSFLESFEMFTFSESTSKMLQNDTKTMFLSQLLLEIRPGEGVKFRKHVFEKRGFKVGEVNFDRNYLTHFVSFTPKPKIWSQI